MLFEVTVMLPSDKESNLKKEIELDITVWEVVQSVGGGGLTEGKTSWGARRGLWGKAKWSGTEE